ncbi:MAG: ABC transporter related protein [Anaerolineales bacterium]|jgi:NitT/TauT family transport system ATP-binding protein|nr:ABC transporter related protein [Anaerolineales bacterium]
MRVDVSTPPIPKSDAQTPAAPVVSIRGVNKIFETGGSESVVAVQDINLEIGANEFVSLIGPSGCGKSTLLRLIADLLTPTSGQLSVNGKLPRQARLDRDYGFVFQAATLYDWRTVSQNVQLPLEIMGYPPARRAARAREMLELVELEKFGRHYPWQLSGGMQQRVAIARALAFEPPLLLMDEPFGALDEFTRERMNMELLKIWGKTGGTVIFVTHSIAEAVFLSNRVVVMSPRPGRITKVVDIGLPRPRTFETREDPRFFAAVTDVRESLREAYGA